MKDLQPHLVTISLSRVTAWRGVGVLVAHSQKIWLRINNKERTGEIKWPGGGEKGLPKW